jgi:hypothetical protein
MSMRGCQARTTRVGTAPAGNDSDGSDAARREPEDHANERTRSRRPFPTAGLPDLEDHTGIVGLDERRIAGPTFHRAIAPAGSPGDRVLPTIESRSMAGAVPLGRSRDRTIRIRRSLDRANGTVIARHGYPRQGIARSLDPLRGTVSRGDRYPAMLRWGPPPPTNGIPLEGERYPLRRRSLSRSGPITLLRSSDRGPLRRLGGACMTPIGTVDPDPGERRIVRTGSPSRPNGTVRPAERDPHRVPTGPCDPPNGVPIAPEGDRATRRTRSPSRRNGIPGPSRGVPRCAAPGTPRRGSGTVRARIARHGRTGTGRAWPMSAIFADLGADR